MAKCTLKANCSKKEFLDRTVLSVECKEKKGYTYGFYHTKALASEDAGCLQKDGVNTEIIKGWNVSGFTIIK